MFSDEKPILVTAAIFLDGDKVLVCQRHHADVYGLQWEFPGGKVCKGENLKSALQREIREELGVDASVGSETFRLRHHYPDRFVEVAFFSISEYKGKIENRIFEKIAWVPRKELSCYQFLEANRGIVKKLAQGEIL